VSANARKFRRAAEALDAGAFYDALHALTPYFQTHAKGGTCPYCEFRALFDRTTTGTLCLPRGEHGVIALLLAGEMERTGDLHQ